MKLYLNIARQYKYEEKVTDHEADKDSDPKSE